MRKARYSAKKVHLPNASGLGYGKWEAKPGNWITWILCGRLCNGRVLGRIEETEDVGNGNGTRDCAGFLAVMALSDDKTHAFIRWVDPADVTYCEETPPRALLTWIIGEEWVTRGSDVAKYIAMAEHGTTCERFIGSRNEPDKPYNSRKEYVTQYLLEEPWKL